MTYTCVGSVRGSCGKRHRSVVAAQGHCDRDARDCRVVGGYSDRCVVRSDGKPLSEGERQAITEADQVRK